MGKANELLEVIRIKREDIESKPSLFLGHSINRLLIKQVLINAYNNLKYTPIKDTTIRLVFFVILYHRGDWMLVSLGYILTKIITAIGFQKGNNIL
jgi:hypothetical protein